MRLLLIASVFCVSFINASPTELNFNSGKKKSEKKEKTTKEENNLVSKNFHTVKKWKITVEYTNGNILSETIIINKPSALSAMDTAFLEAERYVGALKKVRNYTVSPVASNSYVLLANN